MKLKEQVDQFIKDRKRALIRGKTKSRRCKEYSWYLLHFRGDRGADMLRS